MRKLTIFFMHKPPGIEYVGLNGQLPAVVSMSLGGGASSATDNAVENLINLGFTVSAAAGNENVDACNSSPARVAAVSCHSD